MTTRQISETIEDTYGFETSEGFLKSFAKRENDVDMNNHGNPKEHPEVPHENINGNMTAVHLYENMEDISKYERMHYKKRSNRY